MVTELGSLQCQGSTVIVTGDNFIHFRCLPQEFPLQLMFTRRSINLTSHYEVVCEEEKLVMEKTLVKAEKRDQEEKK